MLKFCLIVCKEIHEPGLVYESRKGEVAMMEFFAGVGMAQRGYFFDRTKCDVMYRVCLTSSFFPSTFHLSLNTI